MMHMPTLLQQLYASDIRVVITVTNCFLIRQLLNPGRVTGDRPLLILKGWRQLTLVITHTHNMICNTLRWQDVQPWTKLYLEAWCYLLVTTVGTHEWCFDEIASAEFQLREWESVGIQLRPLGNAGYVACLPLLCQRSKWRNSLTSIVFRVQIPAGSRIFSVNLFLTLSTKHHRSKLYLLWYTTLNVYCVSVVVYNT